MSRDNRELDALVASKVMGWRHSALSCFFVRWLVPGAHPASNMPTEPPGYTTEPSADYLVLKHVRENWRPAQKHQFRLWLTAAMRDRVLPDDQTWWDIDPLVAAIIFYEPGDYSRAALKALGEEA